MRLIDADALKAELLRMCFFPAIVKSAIERMPNIDAKPVVHGRWTVCKTNGFLYCSECKDVFIDADWLQDGKWNYCPNCGAYMRGTTDGKE